MSYGFTSYRVDGLKGPSLCCLIRGKKSEHFFVLEFYLHRSSEQFRCFIDGILLFFYNHLGCLAGSLKLLVLFEQSDDLVAVLC